MAYGDFKDLTRRIASDKMLRDKPFNFAKKKTKKNMKNIKEVLLKWCIHFLIRKIQEKQIKKIFLIKNELKSYTNQLLETLRKDKLIFYNQYLGC